MAGGDGVVVVNRTAEIDTRAPFRSVKEAVTLFGERFILAGEVYAGKLKEMEDNSEKTEERNSLLDMTEELEETKQSLIKAKEETMVMATCLSSLEEELEKTKRELQELKLDRESEKQMMEYEIGDLKFVEDPPKHATSLELRVRGSERVSTGTVVYSNRRYVTFGNATFSEVVVPEKSGLFLERHSSLTMKKKQPSIPLTVGLFSRKKKSSEVASIKTP